MMDKTDADRLNAIAADIKRAAAAGGRQLLDLRANGLSAPPERQEDVMEAVRQAEAGLALWGERNRQIVALLKQGMPEGERQKAEVEGELDLLAIADATDTPTLIEAMASDPEADPVRASEFRQLMAANAAYRRDRRAYLLAELAERGHQESGF